MSELGRPPDHACSILSAEERCALAWLSGCEPDPEPVATVEMPEVCELGEPTPLDDGLPTGGWSGWMQIEGDDVFIEIGMTTEADAVWTEGFRDGLSGISFETFDFGVEPVAWCSTGDPRGTCEIGGPGALDCTIDDVQAGHRGTRAYRFSSTCTWIDERLVVGDFTQVRHTEVALD
ncbi:MAG: hypothetical protein ABMA64_27370 [Myxococcota bacterium]